MNQVTNELRDFAENSLHGTSVQGYAARDAAKVLLINWADALADGSTDNLVADVDEVIDFLRTFQNKARDVLPIRNGGFAGTSAEEWEQRLSDEHDVTVYEAEDLPGHYGYTDCDADDFQSKEAALSAAIAKYFG